MDMENISFDYIKTIILVNFSEYNTIFNGYRINAQPYRFRFG